MGEAGWPAVSVALASSSLMTVMAALSSVPTPRLAKLPNPPTATPGSLRPMACPICASRVWKATLPGAAKASSPALEST